MKFKVIAADTPLPKVGLLKRLIRNYFPDQQWQDIQARLERRVDELENIESGIEGLQKGNQKFIDITKRLINNGISVDHAIEITEKLFNLEKAVFIKRFPDTIGLIQGLENKNVSISDIVQCLFHLSLDAFKEPSSPFNVQNSNANDLNNVIKSIGTLLAHGVNNDRIERLMMVLIPKLKLDTEDNRIPLDILQTVSRVFHKGLVDQITRPVGYNSEGIDRDPVDRFVVETLLDLYGDLVGSSDYNPASIAPMYYRESKLLARLSEKDHLTFFIASQFIKDLHRKIRDTEQLGQALTAMERYPGLYGSEEELKQPLSRIGIHW